MTSLEEPNRSNPTVRHMESKEAHGQLAWPSVCTERWPTYLERRSVDYVCLGARNPLWGSRMSPSTPLTYTGRQGVTGSSSRRSRSSHGSRRTPMASKDRLKKPTEPGLASSFFGVQNEPLDPRPTQDRPSRGSAGAGRAMSELGRPPQGSFRALAVVGGAGSRVRGETSEL